jgi:hypothetical protein
VEKEERQDDELLAGRYEDSRPRAFLSTRGSKFVGQSVKSSEVLDVYSQANEVML